MKIIVDNIGDISVLRFVGKFGKAEDYDLLKQTVQGLLDKGRRDFVFDLKKLNWISSTGLATILHVHYKIESRRGRIAFCDLAERIAAVFGITKMDTVFAIFGNQKEALASLAD